VRRALGSVSKARIWARTVPETGFLKVNFGKLGPARERDQNCKEQRRNPPDSGKGRYGAMLDPGACRGAEQVNTRNRSGCRSIFAYLFWPRFRPAKRHTQQAKAAASRWGGEPPLQFGGIGRVRCEQGCRAAAVALYSQINASVARRHETISCTVVHESV